MCSIRCHNFFFADSIGCEGLTFQRIKKCIKVGPEMRPSSEVRFFLLSDHFLLLF